MSSFYFNQACTSSTYSHRSYADRFLPYYHPENFHRTITAPEDRSPFQNELEKEIGCSKILCHHYHTPPSLRILDVSQKYHNPPRVIQPIILQSSSNYPLVDGTDDFYHQPISQNGNLLAVCSRKEIKISQYASKQLIELSAFKANESDQIHSLCLISPSRLIVAFHSNSPTFEVNLIVYDLAMKTNSFNFNIPNIKRVGSISASESNPNIFATGDTNGDVYIWDIRVNKISVMTPLYHTSEVCGLHLSPYDSALISGTNDNLVFLWDLRNMTTPIFQTDIHKGAVKALSWIDRCHFITGGGSQDRQLYVWTTTLQNPINQKKLNNQITGVKMIADRLFVSLGFSTNCLKSYIFNPHKIAYPIEEEATLVVSSNIDSNRFTGLAAFNNNCTNNFGIVGFETSSPSSPAGIHLWNLSDKKSATYKKTPSLPQYEIR
jgi:WD40 repeat protein